jgi:hypothetical protein
MQAISCSGEAVGSVPGSGTILDGPYRLSFHVGCQNASGLAMNGATERMTVRLRS